MLCKNVEMSVHPNEAKTMSHMRAKGPQTTKQGLLIQEDNYQLYLSAEEAEFHAFFEL
jgi:hypothetical protein